MPSSPVFAASAATALDTTTSPKTVQITVTAGYTLVVSAVAADHSTLLGTPSGGGLTYQLAGSLTGVSGYSNSYVWTAACPTTATITITMSVTAGAARWGFHAATWSTSGPGATSTYRAPAAGAPYNFLTTTLAASAIWYTGTDRNAIAGGSRVWKTVDFASAQEQIYLRSAGNYTVYAAYWNALGAADQKYHGMDAPSGQMFAVISLEIKPIGSVHDAELTFTGAAGLGLTLRKPVTARAVLAAAAALAVRAYATISARLPLAAATTMHLPATVIPRGPDSQWYGELVYDTVERRDLYLRAIEDWVQATVDTVPYPDMMGHYGEGLTAVVELEVDGTAGPGLMWCYRVADTKINDAQVLGGICQDAAAAGGSGTMWISEA